MFKLVLILLGENKKLRSKIKIKKLRLEQEYDRLRSRLALWIGTAMVVGIAIGKYSR